MKWLSHQLASPRRRLRSVLVAALLALGMTFGAPSLALAARGVGDPTCPHGGNFRANACFYGVVQYSTYAEWHRNNMIMNGTLEAQGYHINHTIWSFSGAPCDQWMEIGLTQGFHGAITYGWYVAWETAHWHDPSGYGDWFYAGTSPSGVNDAYEVEYVGGGTYHAFLDGIYLYWESGLGNGSCISEAGLEESTTGSTPDGNFHSDQFDLTPLGYRDQRYVMHYGWNPSQYWVDYPCGLGNYHPRCLDFGYPSASHEIDLKL